MVEKDFNKIAGKPRMAVAYPISDKGVIHFAYGYFFKIPDHYLLYNNTDYKLTETGTNFGIFGNCIKYPIENWNEDEYFS